MTSYEFEVAAKNAVINSVRRQSGMELDITDIQMVWFAHILGYKKAILIDIGPDLRIYEVTYNKQQNQLYVDTYTKTSNELVVDIDKIVHTKE